MSLFAIENIFISILSLALTVIIFRFQQNRTHRLWAFFNLAVAAWAFSVFLVGISSNEKQAILYWRFAFIAVPCLGVVFYHFVLSYCHLKRPKTLKLAYLFALTFAYLSIFTNKIIDQAPLFLNVIFFERAGFCFTIFFIIWSSIVLMAFIEFHFYLRKTTGLQKIQAEFMFWSMLAGFLGGVSTALPGYGVKIYPCYQISIIFYILFTSYAIFKHGVIPMGVVIKRSLFYSSLATSVTIIYFVGIFIFERFFNTIIGYKNLTGSLVSLIAIAIIFIPLKNKIQAIVDKLILKNSPIEIAIQNENLRNEVAQTEKFKSIANLASMLAHEIKNPLTTLASFTEQLKARKDEPGFIDQYEELVTKEIERINTLLHELLQYAKPSQPQIKDTNPNEIIAQIVKLVQSRCDKLKIDIIFSSKTNSNIPGDFNLLEQAIFNLVLNAIDSMPDGGSLTISTETSSGIISQKALYIIRVSDTGCGIDSKDLPYVFEPFFTKKANGTGLGLPITQSIIEKHGGRIEVNSKLNEGTNFNIILNIK